MKKVLYLSVVLLIMSLGCEMSKELSDAQKDAIIEAVKEKSDHIWVDENKSISEESYETFMNLIHKDADDFWQTEAALYVNNQSIINSRQDWENALNNIINSRTGTNVTFDERYFAAPTKDIVLEVQKGEFSVTRKDGSVWGPAKLVHTLVWANNDGEWYVIHGHESWELKEE